jgi:hypothetical protein
LKSLLSVSVSPDLDAFAEFHAEYGHVHLGDGVFYAQGVLHPFNACYASHPHERHLVVVDGDIPLDVE